MTSFTIPWTNEAKPKMGRSMMPNDSSQLIFKATPAFLSRHPSRSGRNLGSVLAPIGNDSIQKNMKKGGKGSTIIAPILTGCNPGSVLGPPIKTQSRLRPDTVLAPIQTGCNTGSVLAPIQTSCNPGSVLAPIQKRKKVKGNGDRKDIKKSAKKSKAASVPNMDNETGTDNQRRHNRLVGKAKGLLSARNQHQSQVMAAPPTLKGFHSASMSNDKCASSRLSSHMDDSAGDILRSNARKTGRGHGATNNPVSDMHDTLPRPPFTEHVVNAKKVYEYRKRRFKFATLRNKKRAC